MATSEPSSTTIASEPSTSTSEIQTDTSEPSQLEVLALNYLRNQEISTIPSRIPKLNPCSICRKAILKFRFQSFVVLDCEHLFHRLCLENYIMRAETDPFSLTCPSCNIIIELTREEAVLASGKYHLQKKQTDTGQGDEALMSSLGFMNDDSRAGQGSQSKQVTMQDQATSPIVIEDDASENNDDERTPDASNRSANVQDNLENTPNENSGNDSQDSATNDGNNNTAQNRPLRRSPRHSSRQSATSGNITREHNILQGLLQELSTPVRGESIENNEVAEDDSEASVPKTLARLFQKACRAETRATKAIQEEISCWYYYGKAYEERVDEIKNARRGVSDQSARNQVYDDTMEHLPGGFTKDTLRKKTQRAVKIYKLFRRIGVDKIKRVISYSANAISKLTAPQIRTIEEHFGHV
jgi:hypothetical protein